MPLILKTLDPKIQLPKFEQLDLESNGSKNKIKDGELSGFTQRLGEKIPLIRIGNLKVEQSSIISVSVYQTGIVPTVHVSIVDMNGTFTSTSFPKTNPLITIYVASTHPKLKSFYQSFLITGIQSIPLGQAAIRYDFIGELYVPNLTGNFIKSYSNMTSDQALKKIAEELNLGFASNEDTTNDSMTWINPNLTYREFIKQIADHAYKTDTGFFECFIDRYYVLNLVNIEKQFTGEFVPDNGYPANYQGWADHDNIENPYGGIGIDNTIPLVISNSALVDSGSELLITDFSLIGDNGEILKYEGFRKRMVSYKHGEANPLLTFFVEPISSQSTGDDSQYQKPQIDYIVNSEVVKWMGIDYSNTHIHYKFAKLLNYHNRLENEKTLLRVKLNGFNQNIVRGSRLPVQLVKSKEATLNASVLSDDATSGTTPIVKFGNSTGIDPEALDPYLSGYYYVKEISYHFNGLSKERSAYTTELILSRKNWIPEPKLETQ